MDQGAENYQRYRSGDDAGLAEIIRAYQDGLILFLNQYVHNLNLAEELAEETFFVLATKKPHFLHRASFRTWLYTIARNQALSQLRRGKHTTELTEAEAVQAVQDELTLEQAYLREEEKILLHRALDRLPEDYALVLYLKFFEDLSNEEIAAVLGKRKRQVENLTYQAKQALRKALQKEGYDEKL